MRHCECGDQQPDTSGRNIQFLDDLGKGRGDTGNPHDGHQGDGENDVEVAVAQELAALLFFFVRGS